jgi:DNA invertase Pin-like site-specific DNA recombinase
MARKRVPAPETAALTAVYARISEIDADDETAHRTRTDGVDRQVADGVALCLKNAWAHLAPFVDNDYSASQYATRERPAYKDMMRLVRAGEVGRIVCYDIDRLYKRPKELEELIDLANAGRVSIVSMHGDLDLSTADGRFTARILVSMAAKSSDDTSRRIRRPRQAWRDKGIAKGGHPAFGWKDPMTPDPGESKLIANAMKSLLAGETLSGIAGAWNAQGVPTKNGGRRWTQDIVQAILTNPRHAGLMTHRGEIVGEAAWPAIVDRDTFERVTATIESRSAHLIGKTHGRYSLSSLLVCGKCGKTLSRHLNNGKPSWRCLKQVGNGGCNGTAVAAEHIEPRIHEVLFAYVDTVELARLVDAGADDTRADIISRIADLERRADEYLDMLDCGELDRKGYARLRQRLLAEQASLTNQLANTERTSVLAPYAGRPGRLQKAWDDLSVDRQRAIISAALAPITIYPATRRRFFDPTRVRFGEHDQTGEALLAEAS